MSRINPKILAGHPRQATRLAGEPAQASKRSLGFPNKPRTLAGHPGKATRLAKHLAYAKYRKRYFLYNKKALVLSQKTHRY